MTDSRPLDSRLAERLILLRQQRRWSLDELAQHSGISRATLSRLERGESSPTASLLGRLCTVYGMTMSRLMAEVEADPPRLMRHAEQTLWSDPETGFQRLSISPPARGFATEMMQGVLPPGAVIEYPLPEINGLEQHVHVLEGVLEIDLESATYRLERGDTLRYRLFGTTRFHCCNHDPVRYLIAMTQSR